MKNILLFSIALLVVISGIAQESYRNTADLLSASQNGNVQIGGYAQVDYNQPFKSETRQNGTLDVHRLVMLFGYRFNERTNFVSEIELEHVSEVYVEQAFLNYRINDWLNFRGGLMLVPMGIVNEFHEPPTFNGVERPNLDNRIVPTTWREIGTGFSGRFSTVYLKYQLYLMNGFNGYDGKGLFRGSDGFRPGRQKGMESFMSSPNLAVRFDYYGISGLNVGVSYYGGKSQSSLFDDLDRNNSNLVAKADSSVVGISMFGLDGRYSFRGWSLRGQYNFAGISNTGQYNRFTGKDLGSSMAGFYLEAGYNLFHSVNSGQKLVPFIRYENYDTHFRTAGSLVKNKSFHRKEIIFGAGWWMAAGAVVKVDYQVIGNDAVDKKEGQLNAGIGIWF